MGFPIGFPSPKKVTERNKKTNSFWGQKKNWKLEKKFPALTFRGGGGGLALKSIACCISNWVVFSLRNPQKSSPGVSVVASGNLQRNLRTIVRDER